MGAHRVLGLLCLLMFLQLPIISGKSQSTSVKPYEVDPLDDAGAHWGRVEVLSAANFRTKLHASHDTWLVEWCTSSWRLDRYCMPKDTLAQLAHELAGEVRVATVNPADANQNEPWRVRYGVNHYPTIHGLSSGGMARPYIYAGERTVAAIAAWARSKIPSHAVQRLVDPLEFLRSCEHDDCVHTNRYRYKAVLFHAADEVPPIYKAVSNRFVSSRGDRVRCGEFRMRDALLANLTGRLSFAQDLGLSTENWPALYVLNTTGNISHWPTLVAAFHQVQLQPSEDHLDGDGATQNLCIP
eukprot:SAG11_NODE_6196_length_1367_cov_1.651420_1_plen_298_part_00